MKEDNSRNLKNTRDDLILDMEECNVVKLEFKAMPWELTGNITKVQDNIFEICTHEGTFKRNISDILYYRLA